jgi:nucleotide-binding universal stress UspA family protein
LDQAESYPPPGQPERRRGQAENGRIRLEHPVIAGYDGSLSSRNALAYAAGMARRLSRSLLVIHVCSAGIYCEPLTGQVIGLAERSSDLEKWLLSELDQVTDRTGIEVHVRTRRGSPARELAAAAEEHGADALVIGAPAHIWHHLAGSVPGWLARHARCPVVVVP